MIGDIIDNDYFYLQEYFKEIPQEKQDTISGMLLLMDNIYHFAYEIVSEFNIHNLDIRELTIGSLYIKTLQSFESVILLSQRGLNAPSKAMLRVMLETVFKLKLICIDLSFIDEYIKSDDYNRAQLFNQILKDTDDIFAPEAKELAAKEFPKLQDVFKQKKYKLEPWLLARRAGMYDFYQLVYNLMSNDVHTSIRSLEKYYGLDDKGDITHMKMDPTFIDFNMVVLTACSILIETLKCSSAFFTLSYEDKLDEYINELKKFDFK